MVCIRDQPQHDTPNYIVAVGNPASFYVAPADSVGRTGNCTAGTEQTRVLHSMLLTQHRHQGLDQNANKDVTGKQVPAGNFLNFRVETNTYSIVNRPGYAGEDCHYQGEDC